MKGLLSKISNRTRQHQADIILVIGVVLISLLSFAVGYIMSHQGSREPIQIEYEKNTKTHSFVS